MKDLTQRILELLKEDDETPSFGSDDTDSGSQDNQENTDQDQSSSTDDNQNDNKDTDTEDNGNDDNENKEEFKADSIYDFIQKTNTKIDIKKESTEPSPIFGSQDTKNHNKYKVIITVKSDDEDSEQKNGSVSFYFWDSVKNTESNKKPSNEDVLKKFGKDIGSINDGISKDEFERICGYDKTDDSTSQKAYDNCRQMFDKVKKIFSTEQIKELKRLSDK